MIPALRQHDPSSNETWLSFPEIPPDFVRHHLKSNGWRYHGGLRAWHHPSQQPPLPPAITLVFGSDEPLSTYRSRRGDAVLDLLADLKNRIRQHIPATTH